jgi:cereblon
LFTLPLSYSLIDVIVFCRPNEDASESEDLLRVLERGVGDDESSEEEERPGFWGNRRVRRRGDGLEVESYTRGGQVTADAQPSDRMETADQPMYTGESSTAATTGGQVAGVKRPRECGWGAACKAWATDARKWNHRAQCSSWPHWVYRQFDAYELARRAAGKFSQHKFTT